MAIFDKIKEIVAEQLGVDEGDITLETSFEELDADSLDIVELIMALEDEFDIEIPDEEAEKLTTIATAVDYVKERTT